MQRRRSDRARLDGRAVFAGLCAVLALPVSINPFFPLLFGPIGTIVSIASVVATDTPANRRTRTLAFVALCLCALFFTIALVSVLTDPQSGE